MNKIGKKIASVIKTLIATYLISAIILLIIAALMYKCDIGDGMINVLIILSYIISTFIGGVIIGKVEKENKYLWGGLLGISYFVVLIVISMIVNGNISESASGIISTMLYCTAGGMIGGMIS